MNFPNLELLLLRVVFALPNASKIGLASKIFCSTGPAAAIEWHRYFNRYLVDSVLPAPDSPETIIDCDILKTLISLIALSAIICCARGNKVDTSGKQKLIRYLCDVVFFSKYSN